MGIECCRRETAVADLAEKRENMAGDGLRDALVRSIRELYA
jgi:hypothetical protein